MPRGDGTGPAGMGPMTGRAAGYCAGYSVPGYANPVPGRGRYGYGMGRGFGRGFGYGRRAGYRAAPAAPYYGGYAPQAPQLRPEDEQKMLEDEITYLKDDLKSMEDRLDELKKEQKK